MYKSLIEFNLLCLAFFEAKFYSIKHISCKLSIVTFLGFRELIILGFYFEILRYSRSSTQWSQHSFPKIESKLIVLNLSSDASNSKVL